jgi:phosphate transport system substrate-binding protein
VAEAVRRDVQGIGFNNLNFAYDLKSGKPLDGIRPLPIDINANGNLDPAEDFYGTHQSMMKAIAEGRYPAPPARDLYLVHHAKPMAGPVTDFLNWIMAEGQAFVPEAGYINLPADKLEDELKKLK